MGGDEAAHGRAKAEFHERVVLVTGAGNGIGEAIAAGFANAGAVVYLTDIDADAAAAAADRIAAADRVRPHRVDVASGQDITAILREIETQHGRLDILVNNAGLNVRGDFRHMSDADWVKIREVNLDGVIRLSRDALPLLQSATDAGAIVNLASIMGHRGLRQLAGYAATKGAVSALTRALAVEYAAFNIRVNAVAPGFIETALTERVLRNPAFSKALLDKTPLRRFGAPAEVAEAVLFLASNHRASFITGAELAIDGGMAAGL